MLRVAKTEIDFFIARLKKLNHVIESDYKVGRTRIIETDKVRVIFKCNGWCEIQNKGDKKSIRKE
jgi:hypothetical protein